MFDWLYDGDEEKYNGETLNIEDVWTNYFGSPRIESEDLIKHRKVQKNILKGAKSGMGSPEASEKKKQKLQDQIDDLDEMIEDDTPA